MSSPAHVLEAVTHPDPCSYYADLAATRPFSWDAAVGCWVAAGRETAAAVLDSDLCKVRPAHEPVPPAIRDSPAADIFRHLVRMIDDGRHGPMKAAIVRALTSIPPEQADVASTGCASRLADRIRGPEDVSAYAFALPVNVIAALLGFCETGREQISTQATAFVRGLSPLATPEQAEACRRAAAPLLTLVRSRLEEIAGAPPRDLLGFLTHEARGAECNDPQAVAANAVGLMMQAQEATAGLIGNALVALSSDWPSVAQERISAELHRTLRLDPPIQNTRRYVVRDGVIAGQAVKPGETILVLLAGPEGGPGATTPAHESSPIAFGHGKHLCPGQSLAVTIAQAGIEALAARRIPLPASVLSRAYRPSLNARIPL